MGAGISIITAHSVTMVFSGMLCNILYDSQAPVCPVCHAVLRPGELQEHMEQEMGRLAQLQMSPPHYLCTLNVRGGPPPLSPAILNSPTQTDTRIGKLKRRRPDEGQDILVDLGGEEEEWTERRRIRMTSMLGGCEGSAFVSSSTSKEGRGDSDTELDVDGDHTLEYGRVQYTEEDIIRCSGQDPGEVEEREALREAVLKYAPHPVLPWPVSLFHHYTTKPHVCVVSIVCINCLIGSKYYILFLSGGSPSTSNGESNKLDNSIASLHRTCKNSDIDIVPVVSLWCACGVPVVIMWCACGDPVVSLWCACVEPVACARLPLPMMNEIVNAANGAKKLCPQCNTITSPGDLR
ncbi:unnamed protein product, partial [Coregonus sp. 'balchen']